MTGRSSGSYPGRGGSSRLGRRRGSHASGQVDGVSSPGWWGSEAASSGTAAIQPGRLRRSAVASRPSVLMRAAQAATRHVRENERARRTTRLGGIGLLVLLAVACSVGVITLNNLVIKRSAELGRLDTERRELRTKNALLASDIARLSAPPRIVKLARRRLGMYPSTGMAKFIYLDPNNRPINRKAMARRAARQAARRAAAQAAATAAAQASGAGAAPVASAPASAVAPGTGVVQ